MIFLLMALVVAAVILIRRRARRSTLSGLNSEKPVFSVEPPTRRIGSRKTERL